MGYAQRLIDQILSDERTRGNRFADEKVYRDEPILRTGADLLKGKLEGGPAKRAPSRVSIAGGNLPRIRNASSRFECKASESKPFERRFRDRKPSGYDSSAFAPWGKISRLPSEPEPTVDLPPLLRQLRKMERGLDAYRKPANETFAQQARIAASYEDEFDYEGEFHHYFPTYRCMTDAQLRGYFSWRTHVRRGNIRKTSLSFAFVHLYELINSIGPSGVVEPDEGYRTLQTFCSSYGALDKRILRYTGPWCRNYAVYHGLDAKLSPDEQERQAALKTVMDLDEEARPVGDDELFDSLAKISSYRIERSRLIGEEGPLLRAAVCNCWRALSTYYRSHRKKTLAAHLFGEVSTRPYTMFDLALFWPSEPHADVVYRLGPLETYRCENNRWFLTAPYGASKAAGDLGALLKTMDATLRDRLQSIHPLKDVAIPKYARSIIEKQIDMLLEERKQQAEDEERARREAEQRRISIDFSKLSGIRAEAASSCEALLVDEERAAGPEPMLGPERQDAAESASVSGKSTAGPEPAPVPGQGAARNRNENRTEAKPRENAAPEREGGAQRPVGADAPADPPCGGAHPVGEGGRHASGPEDPSSPFSSASKPEESPSLFADVSASPFSPAEAAYLRCLLSGAAERRRKEILQAAGISEPMMMDAINEKALDEFGDIALEEGAEGPLILQDYVEDVRGILEA